jgi:hypothetical protein
MGRLRANVAVMDSLNDLPAASRREVVAAVRAALGIDKKNAELVLRASEPLWDAMEQVGGLVDTWGGSEFCYLFPKMCAVIRSDAQAATSASPVLALSVGAIVGGITDTPQRWGDAAMALSRQLGAARDSADSPIKVNVVYHVPGEIWVPDFQGVRRGRYSKTDRDLMVQVAVPDGDYSISVMERLLWSAVAEAEDFGHRRKLFAGELSEVRRLATEAFRRLSE